MAGNNLTVTIFGQDRSASRALQQVATQAARTAQALENLSKSGAKQGDSFGSIAKKAVAVVGVGSAIKSTAQTFGDFEKTLNQLGVVSGATDAQMQQVSSSARELGKSVAGMSSTDAAQAMLELSKGGMSVDQSMQAATGTLNLAAAAQISAADAAGIQSAALNTFGLSADKAGMVADVLANTANAASGEMTDFAQGLAQAGLPAKALGISLQDTSTALGLFANNGLMGSDAGTSLKTMLLSLTNPTAKSQAALQQLGVSAFDASGNFVGLQTVSGQLAAAQKSLTTEQFNAAAATAFGSDAVRAATAFAASGAQGFGDLAAKVNEAGGAQKVAAASTMGLSGALDALKAAGEDAQIQIGEKLGPKTEEFVNKISDMIPTLVNDAAPAIVGLGDAAIGAAGILGSTLGAATTFLNPLLQGVGDLTTGFSHLSGPIQLTAITLALVVGFRTKLIALWAAIQAGAFRAAWQVGVFRMAMAQATAAGVTGGLARVGAGLRAVGLSAAAAGRGLMAAMGGPVGLAIMAVVTALSFMGDSSGEAQQRTDDLKSSVDGLDASLTKVTGSLDTLGTVQLAQKFAENEDVFTKLGTTSAEAVQMVAKGGADLAGYIQKIAANWMQTASGMSLDKPLGDLQDFNVLLGTVNEKSGKVAAGMKSVATVIADGLGGKVSADDLLAAFAAAEQGQKSVEQVFADFKITGAAYDTAMQQIASSTEVGGDGQHYFSKATAETKDAVEGAIEATRRSIEVGMTDAEVKAQQTKAHDDFAAALDAANNQLKRSQDAYDAAKDSLTPWEQASKNASDTQSELADQTDRVSDAIDRQMGIVPSLDEAQLKAAESADSLRESFGLGTKEAVTLTDAIDKHTGRIKVDTEEQRTFAKGALEMRDRMIEVATATYAAEVKTKGHTQASKDAQAAAQGVRDEFVKTTDELTGTAGAGDKVADSLGAIPKSVVSKIDIDNKQALEKAKAVDKTMRVRDRDVATSRIAANAEAFDATMKSVVAQGIPGKSVKIDANTQAAYDRLRQLRQDSEATTFYVQVKGKYVGTTGAPSTFSSGPLAAAHFGGHIGSLLGFDTGGVIPGVSPGHDNLLGLVDGKTPIAVESEEFIVNRRQTKKHRALLEAINAGIAGFAGGGLTSAGALMGIAPRSMGDRESGIAGSLSDLAAAVKDLRESAVDLRGKSNDAAGKVRDAEAARRETLAKGRQSVRDADAKADDRNAAAAKALTEAQRKLADAQSRTTKTAADRLAKEKAIESATRKVNDAESRVAQVRKAGEAAVKKATDAQRAANRAADLKVRADTRAATAADRLADAAKRRADAADKELKATARMRMALASMGRQYDTVTSRLEASSDKVAGLRAERSQLAGSIAGSIAGFGGGITGFADQRGSVGSILAGQKFNLGKVKAFQSNLAKLKKLGLSGSQLSQLASGGEDGMRTAAALASASKGEIRQLNSYESQINRSARASGSSVAGAVVDKRIAAAERENAALRRQQAALGRDIRDMANILSQGFEVNLSDTGVARANLRGEKQLKRLGLVRG